MAYQDHPENQEPFVPKMQEDGYVDFVPRMKFEMALDDALLLYQILNQSIEANLIKDEEIEGWACEFIAPLKKWILEPRKSLNLVLVSRKIN